MEIKCTFENRRNLKLLKTAQLVEVNSQIQIQKLQEEIEEKDDLLKNVTIQLEEKKEEFIGMEKDMRNLENNSQIQIQKLQEEIEEKDDLLKIVTIQLEEKNEMENEIRNSTFKLELK